MSTLENRNRTALLVVDVQNGVMACCDDPEPVVERVKGLVGRARDAGTPVVWVQHCSDEFPEGSDAWQIRPELDDKDDEPHVLKRFGDSFEGTNLEEELAKLEVGRLVVCGAMTDACIRCTTHGGLARGYDVTLVGDAHATEDMREWGSPVTAAEAVSYLNLCWENTSAPGRSTEVTTAAEVSLG